MNPLPSTGEAARLDALRSFGVLDTPPEEVFDTIVRAAAHIAEAPTALISLIDEERQWFKARFGTSLEETPRSIAFCDWTIRSRPPFVVRDAHLDERFAANPLVQGDPFIRFYAGFPLETPEGCAIGSLCVLDTKPRELSPVQMEVLGVLAKRVQTELELRRIVRRYPDDLSLPTSAIAELSAVVFPVGAKSGRDAPAAENPSRSQEQARGGARLEALGRLAGGVAHDFNNLLTVIVGYSQALLDERNGFDEEVREDLAEILEAGKRATTLTGRLLAFGRRQVVEPEVLDLRNVVQEASGLLRRLLPDEVEIRIVESPALRAVEADRTQLDQVLMNLAVNASDAMPDGGTLTIATADAPHGAPGVAGTAVRLEVSDTGSGMTQEVRDRIFEPFFTTKEVDRGTGLGLSTVFGIVRQMGGHIEVDTEVGEGTTFRIFLPASPSAPPRPAVTPPASSPRMGRRETILVVDDDRAVRTFIARSLRRHGYEVIEAPSPGDALLAAENELSRIDLVLTDVSMPRMSGPELVERLREHRPSTRALFMSGYPDVDVSGLEEGQLLGKPVSPKKLLKAVRAWLKVAPGALAK